MRNIFKKDICFSWALRNGCWTTTISHKQKKKQSKNEYASLHVHCTDHARIFSSCIDHQPSFAHIKRRGRCGWNSTANRAAERTLPCSKRRALMDSPLFLHPFPHGKLNKRKRNLAGYGCHVSCVKPFKPVKSRGDGRRRERKKKEE